MTRARPAGMYAATDPPRRVETDLVRRLRAGAPLPDRLPEIGRTTEAGMTEVTFAWAPDDPARVGWDVMVHVNSITDANREDIGPARMEWLGDTGVAALGYLLPDDLVASYRIVAMPRIPDDAGRTPEGWRTVHAAGMPDPRNAERIPNPLGHGSSVLRMPGSPRHPAESADAPVRRSHRTVDLALPAGSPAPWSRLLVPDDVAERLVVLFDGESWDGLPLEDVLRRMDGPSTAVAIVGTGGRSGRVGFLPDADAVGRALGHVLDACRHTEIGDMITPSAVVVAGQSLGGLAAASVVVHRPDLATTAIAQSGSYWHGAPEGTPRTEDGRLPAAARQSDLTGRRLVVQYGRHERVLGPLSRRFADTCRASGADVTLREYPGGHDYAWWMTGLLDALDLLAERGDTTA